MATKKFNTNDELQNSENSKLLIKNGIQEIKNNHWKLIPLGIYGALTPIAINYLYKLTDKILQLNSGSDLSNDIQKFTKNGIKFFAIPLSILGSLEVIALIGKYKFNKPDDSKFLNTPLVNKQNNTPIFLYKYKDTRKKHGEILAYSTEGIKIEEFRKEVESLEYVFGKYRVYNITNDIIDRDKIYIFRIPSKYVKPKILTIEDSFLSDFINLLVVGATGTGKSETLFVILSKLALYVPNVSILISDYKNSSVFKPFRNCKNYYGGENAVNGIIDLYNELKERITKQDEERNKQVKVLFLDEYSSIIDEYDKEFDLKKKVAYILNMGREYNVRIVVRYSKSR